MKARVAQQDSGKLEEAVGSCGAFVGGQAKCTQWRKYRDLYVICDNEHSGLTIVIITENVKNRYPWRGKHGSHFGDRMSSEVQNGRPGLHALAMACCATRNKAKKLNVLIGGASAS